MRTPGWPATLSHAPVVVRPLTARDARVWQQVRERNLEWLLPWDATAPPQADARPVSYAELARRLRREAAAGRAMPFALEVEGRFAGQVTVSNIVRGSAQFASIGYWIDRDVAGRGLMPLAVAMVIDHCLGAGRLHRIEVCIRPENTNSLRVVEKLGLAEVGFAPGYLHIDGAWRDHRIYAVTAEELEGGLVQRLVARRGPDDKSHSSHE